MADFSFSGWIAGEYKVHFKCSLKEQFQSLFLYCKTQEIIRKNLWRPCLKHLEDITRVWVLKSIRVLQNTQQKATDLIKGLF